jgi:hypothetical protein
MEIILTRRARPNINAANLKFYGVGNRAIKIEKYRLIEKSGRESLAPIYLRLFLNGDTARLFALTSDALHENLLRRMSERSYKEKTTLSFMIGGIQLDSLRATIYLFLCER